LKAQGTESDVRSDSLGKLEEYSNIVMVPTHRFRWPLGPDRRLVPYLTARRRLFESTTTTTSTTRLN